MLPSAASTASPKVAVKSLPARKAAIASGTTKRTVKATRKVKRRWDSNIAAHPAKGKYQRFFRMTATAYHPVNEGMEGGRWTATCKDGRSEHGVAVDPDLIPLGTHLWIPGYGHAVADDTGGRIQGHRVDIRLQDRSGMNRWGVRRVKVYVLADP